MNKTTLIAILVFAAVWAALTFLFNVKLIGTQRVWLIGVYLLIYFIVHLFSKRDVKQRTEEEKWKDWPTSGPIGKYGQKGLLFMFYTSGLLTFINPFQLFQIVKQAIGNVKLSFDKPGRIENAQEYKNKESYILPFEKGIEWLVYNGGINKHNSHSWDLVTQRFAYDFVVADEDFNRHRNKGTKVDDYFCYKQNITAVAGGMVVKVVNDKRTAPLVGYGVLDFLSTSFIGNHLIIKHSENEYSFYAHLIKGSISVKRGDKVLQGQVIGRCGHSGYSSEPHLHFHLQDKPDFFFARGLPVQFDNIRLNGREVKRAFISTSDRVENR